MSIRLKVPKKFGKRLYQFEVEGNNLHGVIMEAGKLSFSSVDKCGVCASDALHLDAYITEKDQYEYVKVVCENCRASLTFGKVKNKKDTYFLRRKEGGAYDWQEFKPQQKEDGVPF